MEKINYLVVYFLAFMVGLRQDESSFVANGYDHASSGQGFEGAINFREKFKEIKEQERMEKGSFKEISQEKQQLLWLYGRYLYWEQKKFTGDDLQVIQQIFNEIARLTGTSLSLEIYKLKIEEYLDEFVNCENSQAVIALARRKFVLSDHVFFETLTARS